MLLDYRCERCRVTQERVVKHRQQTVTCKYCGERVKPITVQKLGYRQDHTIADAS